MTKGEIKPSAAKALSKLAAAEQRRAMTERDKKGRVTAKTIKTGQPAETKERHANAKELRVAIGETLKFLDATEFGLAIETLKNALAKAQR